MACSHLCPRLGDRVLLIAFVSICVLLDSSTGHAPNAGSDPGGALRPRRMASLQRAQVTRGISTSILTSTTTPIPLTSSAKTLAKAAVARALDEAQHSNCSSLLLYGESPGHSTTAFLLDVHALVCTHGQGVGGRVLHECNVHTFSPLANPPAWSQERVTLLQHLVLPQLRQLLRYPELQLINTTWIRGVGTQLLLHTWLSPRGNLANEALSPGLVLVDLSGMTAHWYPRAAGDWSFASPVGVGAFLLASRSPDALPWALCTAAGLTNLSPRGLPVNLRILAAMLVRFAVQEGDRRPQLALLACTAASPSDTNCGAGLYTLALENGASLHLLMALAEWPLSISPSSVTLLYPSENLLQWSVQGHASLSGCWTPEAFTYPLPATSLAWSVPNADTGILALQMDSDQTSWTVLRPGGSGARVVHDALRIRRVARLEPMEELQPPAPVTLHGTWLLTLGETLSVFVATATRVTIPSPFNLSNTTSTTVASVQTADASGLSPLCELPPGTMPSTAAPTAVVDSHEKARGAQLWATALYIVVSVVVGVLLGVGLYYLFPSARVVRVSDLAHIIVVQTAPQVWATLHARPSAPPGLEPTWGAHGPLGFRSRNDGHDCHHCCCSWERRAEVGVGVLRRGYAVKCLMSLFGPRHRTYRRIIVRSLGWHQPGPNVTSARLKHLPKQRESFFAR